MPKAESQGQGLTPKKEKGLPRHPETPVGPKVARRKARRKKEELGPTGCHRAPRAIWAPV